MLIFLTGCTFASYIISKVKLSYSGTVDLSRICIESDHQNIRECTGCIKKNATSEFPKKSTLFERQKILGAWEFKIAQLSKLLHTRVHKAKFMHLFNAQQQ
jgi:hypothetical protein